jgi:hypothetical protein
MKSYKPKLTLDRPATYQIKVPGHLKKSLVDWGGRMTITVASDGSPTTTFTGLVDQAALHGLLRRLYSLGVPLISVTLVEDEIGDEEE